MSKANRAVVVSEDPIEVAAQRLKEVDAQIRTLIPGAHRDVYDHYKRLREISTAEWEDVRQAVLTHTFPCLLAKDVYSFCLQVYGHGQIQGANSELLIEIAMDQLPYPSAKQGFAGQGETLQILAELTHTARNKEVLAWYGFKPLEEVWEYEY